MLATSMFVVNLLLMLLGAWALVDCIIRPAAAFPAVERQTKVAWLIFLALAMVILVYFGAISLLGLLAVVVCAYYLVDVRTKVLEVTRR